MMHEDNQIKRLKAAERNKRRYTRRTTRPRMQLTITGNMARVLGMMAYGYVTWRYVEYILVRGYSFGAPAVMVVSILIAFVIDQLFNG